MATHEIDIREYVLPSKMLEDIVEWLESRAALNNLLLGLLYRLARREAQGGEVDSILVGVFEEGEPVLAFLYMPPRTEMVMVSAKSGWEKGLEAAIQFFAEKHPGIVGLVGPEPQTSQFAARFAQKSRTVFRQKIWQLDRIVRPRPCAGEIRLAAPADADLLAGWIVAFFQEAMGREISLAEATQLIRGKILELNHYVWDHEGVQCMAGVERPTRNGITVVLVYTPPQARGHGYASNLVGYMSAMQLRNGRKFLCLHTDADFPTSNKIYRELGYYEVGDGLILSFE